MDDQDYKVSSEIFQESNYSSPCKPTFNPKYAVSRFEFTSASEGVTTDSDGDLIVPRKNSKLKKKNYVDIEHMNSTVLDLVGLQVWRGALLLADWLIHNNHSLPPGATILELGSGVGLTSIVAAMFAPVICTDVNKGDILQLIQSNVEKNKHLTKHSVKVLELDFTSDSLPEEIVANLPNIPVIIAADTVYDDAITEAFVGTVERLVSVPPRRSVYVALEKRFVFLLSECDSAAPCYEYFLERLSKCENLRYEEVPLDFPQYFHYDRVKELILWKITSMVH